MCGIAGMFSLSGGIDLRTLERMVSALRHRGPDHEGVWLNDDNTVGLAQARLAVIDTSPSGNAPMLSSNGRVAITYNGEVYNFREIREELEGLGHSFRSRSDTEVALKAYMQWGIGCVNRFVGMFALALWDEDEGALYLVRDRLGIKPLYYLIAPGFLAFGSEIKSLIVLPQFSKELSTQALLAYLRFQYVPAPHSIFRSVRKLPPGYTLRFDGRESVEERYWHIDDAGVEWGEGSDADVEEEFLRILRQAVRDRLVSDVPLGSFLSGGIDSSLVVALMAEQGGSPPRTFTIGFEDPAYNEAPFAKRVAHHLRCEHTEQYVGPQDLLSAIPSLMDYYDEPFGDPSAIPTFLLSKMTRGYVTVALSGDGGDELFCGYDRYRWLGRMARFRNLPAPLMSSLRVVLGLLRGSWGESLRRLEEEDDLAETYLRAISIFDRRFLGDILREEWLVEGERNGEEYEERMRATLKGRDPREAAMLLDLSSYLVDDLLVKVDRASMAHSLEVRVPLLDHRVVESAFRLPLKWKARGNKTKLLLRRLLQRYLPRELFERPKRGFAVPLGDWFRGELAPVLERYLGEQRLAEDDILKPEGVRRLVAEHRSGKRDHYHRLWILLFLQMWRERYVV